MPAQVFDIQAAPRNAHVFGAGDIRIIGLLILINVSGMAIFAAARVFGQAAAVYLAQPEEQIIERHAVGLLILDQTARIQIGAIRGIEQTINAGQHQAQDGYRYQ